MKVKQGQSFFDMVIQGTGDINQAFDMAVLNQLSATDRLSIGDIIEPNKNLKTSIVRLFQKDNIPATELNNDHEILTVPPAGIGFMAVGVTFKIG